MKPSSSAADIADETADNNADVDADDDGIVHGSSLSVDVGKSSTYNLPFCMSAVRRRACNQFLPFCPTFAGCAWVQQRLCGGSRDEASVSVPATAATDRRDALDEQIELN